MEQYRSYTDPQDENDVTNKRYVDKNIHDQIEKVENDIDDRFKKSLGNIIVDDISCKNLFNINGPYTSEVGSPTISGNSITVPSSEGNGGYTKFSQLIPVDGPMTLSAIISNGNGFARFLLIPLDSSKNVITDLEIGSGYTYLPYYGGYWKDCADGKYSLTLNFPENVKYFQLGFVHVSATFTNVQIEEGDVPTNYSEYKGIGYISGKKNGVNWVKYDDGRMELWGEVTMLANNENVVINFPFPFNSPNDYSIFATPGYNYHNDVICTWADKGWYSCRLFAVRSDRSIIAYDQNIDFQIKGYWK